MSRIDHILARRQEASRPIRQNQKLRLVFDATTGKFERVRVPHHTQGNTWWRTRFADLVDRRASGRVRMRRPRADRPRVPPPEMLPRLEGMSRQVHRRLFREACAIAGVDYRDARSPEA
ncbi:MAG: hypothetical protein ACTHU0_17060 [Kofleriaceae bacterium]